MKNMRTKLCNKLDKSMPIAITILDLAKAFDKVIDAKMLQMVSEGAHIIF